MRVRGVDFGRLFGISNGDKQLHSDCASDARTSSTIHLSAARNDKTYFSTAPSTIEVSTKVSAPLKIPEIADGGTEVTGDHDCRFHG